MPETLFVATTPGLEQPLLDEAARLGEARVVTGGIRLQGAVGLHRRANLELRCASRVFLELGCVSSPTSAEFRRGLRALNLRPFLRPNEPLELETTSLGGLSLPELRAAAAGLQGGGCTLRLRSEPGHVVLSLDTSGPLLYRRGYRQEISRAPLRETLAAGMLSIARHRPDEPIWDPLCGSGTLAIEAALSSRRIATGLHRTFAFERFPSHDPSAFRREKEALAALAKSSATAPIWASDLNAGALGTARRNARRAGVLEELTLFRHDAIKPTPDVPAGTLAISNLPYGKRVGQDSDLPALYRKIVLGLRQSGVARVAFLTAAPAARDWLGLGETITHPIENGGIQCQLLIAEL
jgi:putative N6-adenine-specific DNA methylase